MRNSDGTLNGDSNDNISAKTSGSIVFLPTSSVDENLTSYDLIPVVLNRPPIITINVPDGSKPQIKPSQLADASGRYLYKFPDGTVKVHIGATFTLNIGAVQPDIFNVENGIPTIKAPDQDLFFVWKQDETIIRTRETPSLQSRTIVSGSAIRFERIQPSAAGTYVCEISNDIGGVQSEPITIEVLNPDLDAYFYRNLITNGNATKGVEGWTANNGDFIQRELYKKEDVELKAPNRVDLFGYNIDTMHPRPYQIDTGLIKNVKYNQDFLRKGNGGYFTRDVYKFERAGGSFFVQAYQEIDLTEIQDIIRGSIYGIEGVRAVFGCYIGNAVSQWTPTRNLVLPDSKTDPERYFLGAPRISVENFLTAGPGQVTDQVYVTLEEYDNESRIASTVLNSDGTTRTLPTSVILRDPWDKRKSKYWGQKYYAKDDYKLGITSNGDWVDTTLFVADELYPDLNDRPTHGQYLEFNRVVLERLNPKTTKIRIAMNFVTNDWRMYEHWDYQLFGGDRIYEHIGWEQPYKKNTFGPNKEKAEWIRSIIDWSSKYKDRPPAERYPLAPPPRVAVTGLNFALLPIERLDKKTTDYYTSTALSINNKPATKTPSAIDLDLTFDPLGLLNRELFITFNHNSPRVSPFNNNTLEKDHRLTIELTTRQKGDNGTPTRVRSTANSLFPFAKGKLTYVYGENILEFDTNVVTTENLFKTTKIRGLITKGADFKPPYSTAQGVLVKQAVASFKTAAAPAWTPFAPLAPAKDKRRKVEWKNNAKYMLNYVVIPGDGPNGVPRPDANTVAGINYNSYFLVLDLEGESPVTLYRSSTLAGGRGEAEFRVTDYTIGTNGTLTFNLPVELLTTKIQDGGLGIPYKEDHDLDLKVLRALDIMKLIEADSTNIYGNGEYIANRNYNIDELWKTYFLARTGQKWLGATTFGNYMDNAFNATNTSGPFKGEDKRGAIVALLYNQFKNDIKAYLYGTGSDVPTLAKLKSDWKVDALGTVTIKIKKKIPDPTYRTSLYAVRPAPQTGTNANGTPIYGTGPNGEKYNIQYPVIKDSVIIV